MIKEIRVEIIVWLQPKQQKNEGCQMPHKQIVKIRCHLLYNSLLHVKYKESNSVKGRS